MSRGRCGLAVAGGLVGAAGTFLALTIVTSRGSSSTADNQGGNSPALIGERAEPPPEAVGAGVEIGSDGGSAGFDDVAVVVPARAISEDDTVIVSAAATTDDSALSTERVGPVVHVDHTGVELEAPIEVRWDLSSLDDVEAATAVPVRWDPDVHQWRPLDDGMATIVHDDGRLLVSTTEFSFLTWISNTVPNAGQTLGEILGSRRDAPQCSDEELPPWVRQVVRPDEDLRAAPLRTCAEPDTDGVITVRVANNRTFTQQLTHVEGDQQLAWTWRGPDRKLDLIWILYDLAHDLFDDESRMLVPPTAEVAFGVQRPEGGGQVVSVMEAEVTATTLLVDIVIYLIGKVSTGGFDDATIVGQFVTSLYECGGREVAGTAGSWGGVAGAVITAITSCSTEVLRPSSALGNLLDDAVRSGRVPARLERDLHRITRLSAVVTATEVAHYLSDQAAHAWIGDVPTMTFRLDGKPGRLGAWKPTCADLAIDSNRLYRNLALQDTFSDTSRDLWEFDEWIPSASVAVEPLATCPFEHVASLAHLLPDDWGDPVAAQQVADQMHKLLGGAGTFDVEAGLMNAPVPSLCEHPSGRLVNGELPIERMAGTSDPGYVVYRGGHAVGDVTGDQRREIAAVIGCSQGGVSWPDHIVIYRDDLSIIGTIDSGDLLPEDPPWRAWVDHLQWSDGHFVADVLFEYSAIEPIIEHRFRIDVRDGRVNVDQPAGASTP